MSEKITDLREELAEVAHSQWSGWMAYLFSKGEFNDDGTWTMPVWAVDRWTRQMRALFADLSAEEKDTDLKEADKFLKIFEKRITELEDMLRSIKNDANMALDGSWEKGDEGFRVQIEHIDAVLGDGEST